MWIFQYNVLSSLPKVLVTIEEKAKRSLHSQESAIPGFSVPIPILIPCPTLGRFRDRYRFQGWARFDSNTDSDHFWAIPRPIRFWQLLVDSYTDFLPLIRGCPKIGQQVPFVPEFTLNGARFKLKFDTDSDTDSRDGHDSIPIPILIPGMGTIRFRYRFQVPRNRRFRTDSDSIADPCLVLALEGT